MREEKILEIKKYINLQKKMGTHKSDRPYDQKNIYKI